MSKPIIICVDDEKIILTSLKNEINDTLKSMFYFEFAESAEEALELISEIKDGVDIPIIISDYQMPGMKGDELLIKTFKNHPNSRRILLTGQVTKEGIINIINNANLYSYIAKPWEKENLMLTITEAFKSYYKDKQIKAQKIKLEKLNQKLEVLVRERTEKLKESDLKIKTLLNETLNGVIQTFVALITNADEKFKTKSLRLEELARIIASEFYPNQIWEIETAAKLSQLGCLNLDKKILRKYLVGEFLEEEEINVVKLHILQSSEIIGNIPLFDNIRSGIANIYYNDNEFESTNNISKVLRVIIEYDLYNPLEKNKTELMYTMENSPSIFENKYVHILKKLKITNSLNKTDISVKELQVGMQLAEDILDAKGNILFKHFDEIDVKTLKTISYFSKRNNIIEPLYIYM